MKLGSRRTIVGAMGTMVVCLLGIPLSGGQAAPEQRVRVARPHLEPQPGALQQLGQALREDAPGALWRAAEEKQKNPQRPRRARKASPSR